VYLYKRFSGISFALEIIMKLDLGQLTFREASMPVMVPEVVSVAVPSTLSQLSLCVMPTP
jgi:predicted RNA-binding protein with EMAP domain